MKKALGTLLFGLVPFAAGMALIFAVSFRASVPRLGGEVSLNGLREEVRIVRDNWGIPHIFAANEEDLSFAAGYAQAQDRLWEMDLIRRMGTGRLSEVIGPAGREWDRIVRTIGFRESVRRDAINLTDATRKLLLAYAEGVNALMGSRKKLGWPPEFMILGYRPEPWRVEDSLVIKALSALGLGADVLDEVLRTKIVLKVGKARAREILQEGIEIPEEINLLKDSPPDLPTFFLSSAESNNWVLSGDRTLSGKPLLANDPHLGITLPPLWYEMHMDCPTLRATGVAFPGMPVIVIGHNGTIAWGMTNSFADVQDLYIEKLNDTGDQYWNGDAWKLLDKREEEIKVRWRRKPERFEVLWTERGPIISPTVLKTRVPLSLRWTAHDGSRSLEGLYLLNKARSWADFCAAMALIDVPPQNFVYADTQGNIGYYLGGKIPLRMRSAAQFPYPGWKPDGRWTGYLDETLKPNLLNPESGLIVTANNKVVPAGYPTYIGSSWLLPFRAERVRELLEKTGKHSVASLKTIQNDIFSKQAELMLPYVKRIGKAEGNAGNALRTLSGWDGTIGAGPAAAVFEFFMDAFTNETFKDELGDILGGAGELLKQEPTALYRILADRESPWFDDVTTPAVENRDDIIRRSLDLAYAKLKKRAGPPATWDWTKIHALRLRHPLGRFPFLGFFNGGTYPMTGDVFTVRASFALTGHGTSGGASYRLIADLGDLEKSVSVLTSGESGHFLSRHYKDQLPLWRVGAYHPVLFEKKTIEAKARDILRLKPAGR